MMSFTSLRLFVSCFLHLLSPVFYLHILSEAIKKTGLLLLFYRSYYFSYIGFIPRLVISQSAVYFVVSIHARSFHRVRLHLIDARLDFMSARDTDFSLPATAVKLVLAFHPSTCRGGGILACFLKQYSTKLHGYGLKFSYNKSARPAEAGTG